MEFDDWGRNKNTIRAAEMSFLRYDLIQMASKNTEGNLTRCFNYLQLLDVAHAASEDGVLAVACAHSSYHRNEIEMFAKTNQTENLVLGFE